MAKRFLSTINLPRLSSDPASGSEGELYYNTTTDTVRIYNGSIWSDLSGAGASSNSFETFSTPNGTSPVADSATDTLTITESNGIVITGNSTNDSIQFSTNATSLNTASTIVSRDSSQSFDITGVDFDTTDTIASAVGRLHWDDGEGTLSLGLKGGNVNLSVGQEVVALCYNGTGSTINKGSVVYISGAQGQRPSITLSDADTEVASSKTFGVVAENILNGAEGLVCTFGIVTGLDTSSFTAGQALWLSSTAGQLTNVIPTQPAHSVFIGYCLHVNQSSGRIFVNPQNGYELQELHNVLISDIANNHILSYDGLTSLWKNQSLYSAIDEIGNVSVSGDFNLGAGKIITIGGTPILSATNYAGNASTVTNGVYTTGTYANPAWITELDWSKITSTPTSLLGYGITDTGAVKTYLALQNVENTALSTWAGSINITTLGTITSGTWNASVISETYLDASLARVNSPTFSGTVVLPGTTSIGNVNNLEISYLDGVTSSIQTQLNNKLDSSTASSTYAPIASPSFTGTVSFASATVTGIDFLPSQSGNSGKYLTTNGTAASWAGVAGSVYSNDAPASPSVGQIWVEADVDVSSFDPRIFVRWNRVLSSSQSTFSGVGSNGVVLEYTPGFEQVYLNGVLLLRSTDYTASDGSTIVLSSNAVSGDVVEVVAQNVTSVANTYSQTQVDSALALKANLASPTFTGTPVAPTASVDTNTTQIATTEFVISQGYAKLASPTFTGTVVIPVSTNSQSSSYTLSLSDSSKLIEINVSTANNVTIPLNSSVAFPIGTRIDIIQTGSGQTTIVPTSGVTMNSYEGANKLSGQWAAATLIKRNTDTWALIGNITA